MALTPCQMLMVMDGKVVQAMARMAALSFSPSHRNEMMT